MPAAPAGGEAQSYQAPTGPQQPAGQPGYGQPAYQAPYRAPRAPFTGNLHDHAPFLIVFIVALGVAFIQTFGGEFAPGGGAGWKLLFDNDVVEMLFGLIFWAAGVIGLAGCIGLWRFREWARNFIVVSAAAYGASGVLTLIAGGTKKGDVASLILWGILMIAIAGGIIFYMMTDEVRSRMQR